MIVVVSDCHKLWLIFLSCWIFLLTTIIFYISLKDNYNDREHFRGSTSTSNYNTLMIALGISFLEDRPFYIRAESEQFDLLTFTWERSIWQFMLQLRSYREGPVYNDMVARSKAEITKKATRAKQAMTQMSQNLTQPDTSYAQVTRHSLTRTAQKAGVPPNSW